MTDIVERLREPLRETFAKIIDGMAFRPRHISGDGLSETEKEKWLRARNVALFKADQIHQAIQARLREPE
jgi:hypothetical protein